MTPTTALVICHACGARMAATEAPTAWRLAAQHARMAGHPTRAATAADTNATRYATRQATQ